MKSSFIPYKAFRFAIRLPNGDFTSTAIIADTLSSEVSLKMRSSEDGLWVGRAHAVGKETLGDLFWMKGGRIEVYLLNFTGTPEDTTVRVVPVRYERASPRPLHLDASLDAVAMDYVLLTGVVYETPYDIGFDALPPELKVLIPNR